MVSPLAAQTGRGAETSTAAPAPTNQDIEALKRQMQALIAAQMAVQKQLDEIKAMLKAGAGAPAQAAHPVPAPAIANCGFRHRHRQRRRQRRADRARRDHRVL